MAGVAYFRDPGTGSWIPLAGGLTGGVGPQGPPGPDGLFVQAAQPTQPEAELWVDINTVASAPVMMTVSTASPSGAGTDVGHLWVQY